MTWGFVGVGEDSGDEGEEEGDGPEPWAALCAGEDEEEQGHCAEEWCCIAEVAGAAEGEVKQQRCGCGYGESCIGQRGEEPAGWVNGDGQKSCFGAENVAECVRREAVAGEEDDKCPGNGDEDDGKDLGTAALGYPKHGDEA